jgi:hypothetical protein
MIILKTGFMILASSSGLASTSAGTPIICRISWKRAIRHRANAARCAAGPRGRICPHHVFRLPGRVWSAAPRLLAALNML